MARAARIVVATIERPDGTRQDVTFTRFRGWKANVERSYGGRVVSWREVA